MTTASRPVAAPVALVTGASAGLGAEFARQLAAGGHDLILTARRADRLEALAAELRARHGIAVHVVAADLAAADGPDRLIAEVASAGLAIDLLVNNAGLGHRGAFATTPLAGQLATIDVNIRALVTLSHAVLPAMVARGRGAILNIGSTAGFQPGPWMATYYASKAFVLSFSEALHEEVRGHGISVTALCPGPVRTEFAGLAGMDDVPAFERTATSPDRVVRDGLAAVAAARAIKVSGAMNAVGAAAVRTFPRSWVRRLVGRMQATR